MKVAPGITTSSKKLLATKGIATRNKKLPQQVQVRLAQAEAQRERHQLELELGCLRKNLSWAFTVSCQDG